MKFDQETDVLVVGSGFAGLTAALEAHDAGAKVVILEKRRVPGGNSIISGGGYNAVDPERQAPQGIKDSIEKFYEDTMSGGDYRANPEIVRIMVENALDGLHWLEEKGVTFDPTVEQVIGSLWPRCHRPRKPLRGGAGIIKVLLSHIKKRKIQLLLEHKVTKIIREKPLEGRVLGVEVETRGEKFNFRALKAVIIASGGFGADFKMLARYDPRLSAMETTNHREATGECITMAEDIGACVIHMDYIQCIPSVIVAIDPSKYIYVNKEGARFIAEDARRDTLCEAILRQPDKCYFTITDAPAFEEGKGLYYYDQVMEGIRRGSGAFKANTVEELGKKLKIPQGNLVKTITNYNQYVDEGKDLEFGKSKDMLKYRIETPPFYGAYGRVAVHYTCGGLMIKPTTCQVIDRHEEIIPGLYAVGEVTGGADGTNRVGSNATPMCIVFGRICGKKAAEEKTC
jgi:flavocytochrome c